MGGRIRGAGGCAGFVSTGPIAERAALGMVRGRPGALTESPRRFMRGLEPFVDHDLWGYGALTEDVDDAALHTTVIHDRPRWWPSAHTRAAETFTFESETGERLMDIARLDTVVTVVDVAQFLERYRSTVQGLNRGAPRPDHHPPAGCATSG